MEKKNHCFHARTGADRYRMALLPLYPQLLQLREIVKRLAAMHRPMESVALDVDASVAVQSPAVEAQSAAVCAQLASVETEFELFWETALEAAGVLANSFAPYPHENCHDDASEQYRRLWSAADAEFFTTTVKTLKNVFQSTLETLRRIANHANDAGAVTGESKSAATFEHSASLRQLCRETRLLEATDARLKHNFLTTIEFGDEHETAQLLFPFSSSRLFCASEIGRLSAAVD